MTLISRRSALNGAASLVSAAAATALLSVGAAFAADPIRIGFHAPMTGFAAGDGKSASLGAELAVSQINAAGGVLGRPLKLVTYDDQAKADQAVPIANKLVGEGVAMVISGSYSGPTRAAAGVFQAKRVPFISAYAVHPDITRAGDHVFRTSFVGEVQGRAGAKLMGKILGAKKVVIITINNDFGQSLVAGFKEKAADFGVKVVNEYSYSIKDRQFGSIVAGVRRDNPDAIYATGYFFTGGPLVSQLRAAGVKVPIVGMEGFDSQHFISIAKKAAEGVIITTSLDRDTKKPVMRKFIDGFEKKAGFPADMVAASTHTAVLVAADAIRRAGSPDRAAIRNALAATKDLEVSTGKLSFNALGEIYHEVSAQKVTNGAFRHYATIDDPELLAPPSK